MSYLEESNPARLPAFCWVADWVADGVDRIWKKPPSNGSKILGMIFLRWPRMIVELPWLVDGVTQPEPEVVEILYEVPPFEMWRWRSGLLRCPGWWTVLPRLRPAFCPTSGLQRAMMYRWRKVLTSLPWLVDGITQTEAGVLSDLQYTAHDDVSLAERLSYFPLVGGRHHAAGVSASPPDLRGIQPSHECIAGEKAYFVALVGGRSGHRRISNRRTLVFDRQG